MPSKRTRRQQEAPRGPWLSFGVAALVPAYEAAMRLEAGIPFMNLSDKIRLALHIPNFFRPGRHIVDVDLGASIGSITTETDWAIFWAFVPGLALEARIYEGNGAISIVGQAGIGVGVDARRIPDRPFQPAHWNTLWMGVFRSAGSVRYTFPFGLLIEVQPLGFAVFAHDTDVVGRNVHAVYDFSFLVGYRF